MTLTEFLLARIAEDEAVAEHTGGSQKRWEKEPYPGGDYGYRMRFPSSTHISDWSRDVGSGYFPVTEHIARHDPARVLAECEAKRRIVEELCYVGGPGEPEWVPYDLDSQSILQLLAAPYANHPDFDEDWRT
jgi:hypothetical protein